MSDITPEKIELSQHQTRNWMLLGVIGALLLLVQGFFTYVITSTGAELRETNHGLVDLVTTVKVQQVQQENLREEVNQLNEARKEAGKTHQGYETRLSSIEQRLALHDQWISAHTK